MNTRSQQTVRYWPTAKAYAVAMGLPYPIRMRHPQADLKPGLHPLDNYIKALVLMLGKGRAAQVLNIKERL